MLPYMMHPNDYVQEKEHQAHLAEIRRAAEVERMLRTGRNRHGRPRHNLLAMLRKKLKPNMPSPEIPADRLKQPSS